MHVSYWESFLKAESRYQELRKSATLAKAERSRAWAKIMLQVRAGDVRFDSTYYFYDKAAHGRKVFVVNVNTRTGELMGVVIVNNPTFVVTDMNHEP